MKAPLFRPSGDTGLTVVLGERVDEPTRARVLRWREAIDHAGLPGVTETVPTYTSVLLHYDPLRTSQSALIDAVQALDGDEVDTAMTRPRRWTFPFCADGPEHAPDLGLVAEQTGLREAAVLDALEAAEQVVYMLGFAPGQPYLGDLPEDLSLPRRSNPIASVPAGSILTATAKTVIYPMANPTGWHVIGHCPVPLFDAAASDPVLLAPGDTVRFTHVSSSVHSRISAGLQAGEIDPRRDMVS